MMVKEIMVCVILLLVGIAVLVTIHICMAGRASRRSSENNTNIANIGDARINSRKSFKMAEEEINKLPCFEYNIEREGVSHVECAVCLESFDVGDICRLLPNCKHNFHVQCIDMWLSKTGVCPICRTHAGSMKIKGDGTSSSEVIVELV